MEVMHPASPFTLRPAGHVSRLGVSNSEYHARCDGISNSMLSVFLDDPALFEGYYVSKRWQRPSSTTEQAFGSLAHEVILEGGLSRVVEIPPGVLAKDGSRRGSAWHLFAAENEGATILKPEEIAPLRDIRKNVEDHPVAARLLYESDGETEFSIEWTDDETGLLLRSRLDRLVVKSPSFPSLIADVKTCARVDPKSFADSCYRWGYHRQAAFYRRGAEALTGDVLPFVFVAVRKTPPYSVACYELSDDFIEAGEQEVSRGLSAIAACRDSGIWSSSTANQILTLDAPRWGKFDNEWSLTE